MLAWKAHVKLYLMILLNYYPWKMYDGCCEICMHCTLRYSAFVPPLQICGVQGEISVISKLIPKIVTLRKDIGCDFVFYRPYRILTEPHSVSFG